jgi:ankyrin repeat protein
MKNPYIIPSLIIAAAILAGFWMLKPSSEPQSEPQKVVTVQPPDISIWDAAEKGNIEAVKQNLTEGVDVNAKEQFGMTPLHYAARSGHKEIVELLIAEGADVNAKDGDGFTPLHPAAYMGQKEIVELLIAKGADMNAKTDGGFAKPIPKEGQLGLRLLRLTPLDVAIRAERTETADLLRKHGGKTGEELKAEGK